MRGLPQACLAGAAGLALVWSAAARGQEDAPPQLAPVVVSASALPLTEASVNQHVTVYTREQLEREAPAGLADFLGRRAGLMIDRKANSGGFGSLFLRGADPSHVVVLVDGIRQNDPLSSRGSAVDLNTLTLDDVERIEIVRGNSTVAHGEALAGVVQIFTRAPGSAAPARAGLEVGGKGLAAASASIAQGPWRAGVVQREDGERSVNGSSRTRAANLSFREQWAATQLQAQLRFADSDNYGFPDDSGGPRYAVNRSLEQRHADTRQLGATLSHQLSATQTLDLRLAYFERRNSQDTPAVFPGVRDPFGLPATDSDGRYRRNEAQANWRWQPGPDWDLLLGAGYQSESGRTDSTLFYGGPLPASFAIDRDTTSLVGEARKAFGPWNVQLGLRYEHTPGQESMWNPALGVQYQMAPSLGRLGMSLSSAGKLPSFYALGNPLVGNPDLKPEHSRQAELYYALPDDSPWKGRLTLFLAQYRDLIDFDAGPPPMLVNRSEIRAKGIEFSLRRSWSKALSFYAEGTLMDISDPENGPPLRFRPKQQASAGLDVLLAPQWRLQSGISYIGARYDSSIPTGQVRLGGYAEANMMLTWSGRGWQVYAGIDNLFDHQADEAIGTPIVGRRLRAGVRWSL